MFAPEVEKTRPWPRPTPRMSVVACGLPTAVFQMISPVLPLTAKTFCCVVWTYSTPSWATTVHSWYWAVLPPSRWVTHAPASCWMFFRLIWLSVE